MGYSIGMSLSSYTPVSPKDFGYYGYGHSNYFDDEISDNKYSHETTIGLEYYFSEKFSVYGNI